MLSIRKRLLYLWSLTILALLFVFSWADTAKAEEMSISEEGLCYQVHGQEVHIFGYRGSDTESRVLVIPEKIDGYTVRVIEYEAFFGNKQFWLYVLPDTITEIHEKAFLGETLAVGTCDDMKLIAKLKQNPELIQNHLKDFSLPDSIRYIADFRYYYLLREGTYFKDDIFYILQNGALYTVDSDYDGDELIIPSSAKYLVSDLLDEYNDKYTTLVIPGHIKVIPENFAMNLKKLEKVIIEPGVEEIHADAFSYCPNLKSISIPSTVTFIGDLAFTATKWEKEQKDGFIILGDGILWGHKGEYKNKKNTIPNKVKRITNYWSFARINYEQDKPFHIPQNLEYIHPDVIDYLGGDIGPFIVDAKNKHYASKDGSLYSKDMKTMYRYGNRHYAEKFTIPNSVKTISTMCFKDNHIKTLTIPKSVTAIEDSAFFNFYTGHIVIPSNVKTLGAGALALYAKTVTLSEGLEVAETLGFECDIMKVIKKDGTILTAKKGEIILPSSLKKIGFIAYGVSSYRLSGVSKYYMVKDGVLFNKDGTVLMEYPVLKSNTSYVIPKTVKTIGPNVHFPDKFSLTISENVQNIFSDTVLWKMKEIQVDKNNQYYASKDGALFTKDFSELLRYSIYRTSTSYTMPNATIIVREYAFYRANYLKEITVSKNLKTVEKFAFSELKKLEKVDLGKSIEEIGFLAFSYNSNLKEVYLPNTVYSFDSRSFTAGINDTYPWTSFRGASDKLIIFIPKDNKINDFLKEHKFKVKYI